MTDKQIIIYKKECYNEPHCSLNQVLEQLEAYKMEAEEGKEINAELKAENEGLKRQHQGDKGLITSTGKMNYQLLQEYDKLKTENDECIKDNEYLKTIIKDFTQEVVKLKATLTEIKFWARELLKRTGQVVPYEIKEILQTISEVENEHNG